MRIAVGLLTITLLVLGVHTLARGDDGDAGGGQATAAPGAAPAADDVKVLRARLEALELEVAFLRAREEAVTAYLLQGKERSESFAATGAQARQQGFEHSKTPTPSRVTLLRGLEAVWKSVGTDLPDRTKEDRALLKRITAHRKLNRLDK